MLPQVLVLALGDMSTEVRALKPLNGFVACSLAMSERVEVRAQQPAPWASCWGQLRREVRLPAACTRGPLPARALQALGHRPAAPLVLHPPQATVSKVTLWVGGTLVGGALGFLAMLHPALATNPLALLAIICAVTFAVGLASAAQLRVGAGHTARVQTSLAFAPCCQACLGAAPALLQALLATPSGAVDWLVTCLPSHPPACPPRSPWSSP